MRGKILQKKKRSGLGNRSFLLCTWTWIALCESSRFQPCVLLLVSEQYVMRCAIWYYLYNLKNVKNSHGGVLILVKLQVKTPSWVFFTFFKLYKWHQIAQRSTYLSWHSPFGLSSRHRNFASEKKQF